MQYCHKAHRCIFFFFNDTATTEIYTLSLHDALPISVNEELLSTNEELETSKEETQSINEELQTVNVELRLRVEELDRSNSDLDRKSTRLNSSHLVISYAVFCLKKKRTKHRLIHHHFR